MTIEWEHPRTALPPLKQDPPPAVAVEALVAVAEVHLLAADVPAVILRQFYEGVLGLKLVAADAETLAFVYQRRRVILTRRARAPGHLGLLVKDFSDVMARLRQRAIAYEVLHADAGLTRMAFLRDPAGNWVQLVETRAF